MFLSSCKDFLKILFFSTARSMIFARFFYLVQVLVFQNKCLFNFDFEILNLANNFCAAEEVLWLLSLRKFSRSLFCGTRATCLSDFTTVWFSLFFQRIRKEFRMLRISSRQNCEHNSHYSSCEVGIRENFYYGGPSCWALSFYGI